VTRLGIAARVACMGLAFVVLAPVQALARRAGSRAADKVPVAFHRLFLRLFGIRLSIRGQPAAPGTPTLVLANHVSWLDIPVLASTGPLAFVAKSEIAAWPIFGFLARLQRCIFIDRNRRAATAEVNHVVAARLTGGDVIVLFPEGTTGDGNRLLPFRSSIVGAARAALGEAHLAIRLQPLAVAYTRRNGLPVTRRDRPGIAWYGDMDLLPHLASFLRDGPVDAVLVWGEPIEFDRASDRKRATLAAEASVRRAVRSANDA
jgi:1-acyl-sn-glycerol-3-phosphate acyltransferase